MNRYVLMGIQGCGKGTQAALLAEALDIAHVNVGGLFRRMAAESGPLGCRLTERMAAGEFLPDDLVIDVVNEALAKLDDEAGYILDGFPRNNVQAEAYLSRHHPDGVIHIRVPDDVVVERITARRNCDSCGFVWNLIFNPPAIDDICDTCGGQLKARADDNPEAIRERLATYHHETVPVLELFGTQVIHVEGEGSIEDVQAKIRRAVGLDVRETADVNV